MFIIYVDGKGFLSNDEKNFTFNINDAKLFNNENEITVWSVYNHFDYTFTKLQIN